MLPELLALSMVLVYALALLMQAAVAARADKVRAKVFFMIVFRVR
jgi:hypothetical protein